jgi:hypothetical protein
VHGGRGEALTKRGEMEGGKDKGKKEECLYLIMMDDDQIQWILGTTGKTCSRVPYQYKVNTKKRVVAAREGLVSDEEEVEDLWDMEKIEEILCATYEMKTRAPRVGREGNNPIHRYQTCAASYYAKRPRTRLVHESRHKQCTWDDKDTDRH